MFFKTLSNVLFLKLVQNNSDFHRTYLKSLMFIFKKENLLFNNIFKLRDFIIKFINDIRLNTINQLIK